MNLVVLCNARSLRESPFYNYKVDTVGMNIAFRFWHEIGWYPTYYISLDKNVNINYAEDIYNLITNSDKYGIKKFLLRKIILSKYPELKHNKKVYFLNDLNKKSNKGFKGTKKSTTGSFAIRWGIYLGYKHIYVLGVDGFTPLKNPKSLIDPKTKRLKQSIVPNPNKFFDGYERKGDILHITKKPGKARNKSHKMTFKSIQYYVKRKKVAKVIVASKSSKMLSKIFPYAKIPNSFYKPKEEWISVDWTDVTKNILG